MIHHGLSRCTGVKGLHGVGGCDQLFYFLTFVLALALVNLRPIRPRVALGVALRVFVPTIQLHPFGRLFSITDNGFSALTQLDRDFLLPPTRHSPEADTLQRGSVRHLVLVAAALLDVVTLAVADPVRAVHLVVGLWRVGAAVARQR